MKNIPPSDSSIVKGIAASPGIGIGKIFLLKEDDLQVVRKQIKKEDTKKEIQRFRKALDKTKHGIKQDKQEMLRLLGKSHAKLADAYLLILDDPILTKDVEKEISRDLVNAEFAVKSSLDKISQTFDALVDEYFRERKNDILEMGNKILRHLLGKEKRNLSEMTEESIVVAHSLLPSDTVSLKTDLVAGFAIDVGGKTSHTAILAQSMAIPAVVGLKNITSLAKSGDTMIINGNQGEVILNPEPQTLENYDRERDMLFRETQELTKLRNLPSHTLDGKKIELSANIESVDEVKSVFSSGAEGIGLFRTEFLFLNRTDLPSEGEQYAQYSKVVKQTLPHSVIFRTIDIGGDKMAPLINEFSHEKNPFLGLRGMRFCLKYPEIFKTQLRAILKASADGKVKIMLPMVADVTEFLKGKTIFESVKNELLEKNIPFDPKVHLGAMVEVPSAAITADLLAKEADFLSIGTNDLIQYTLAIDRVNENVAALYEPHHLSILRLIKNITEAAHSKGKWVGICGEMAAETQFTQLLLGLGLDELSVAPSFIPKVKKTIRAVNHSVAKKFAREILSKTDYADIQEGLNKVKLMMG